MAPHPPVRGGAFQQPGGVRLDPLPVVGVHAVEPSLQSTGEPGSNPNSSKCSRPVGLVGGHVVLDEPDTSRARDALHPLLGLAERLLDLLALGDVVEDRVHAVGRLSGRSSGTA